MNTKGGDFRCQREAERADAKELRSGTLGEFAIRAIIVGGVLSGLLLLIDKLEIFMAIRGGC